MTPFHGKCQTLYNTSTHFCTSCHRFRNMNDESPQKRTRTTEDGEEDGFGCSLCTWKGKSRNALLGHSRIHKVRLLLREFICRRGTAAWHLKQSQNCNSATLCTQGSACTCADCAVLYLTMGERPIVTSNMCTWIMRMWLLHSPVIAQCRVRQTTFRIILLKLWNMWTVRFTLNFFSLRW